MLHDLPAKLETIHNIKVLQYADDICLFTTSGFTRTEVAISNNRLQLAINNLQQYADDQRIGLNAAKTKYIIITKCIEINISYAEKS